MDSRATGALVGVVACVLIDMPEAGPVVDTIRAFGGSVHSNVQEATHVIVANHLSSSDVECYRTRLAQCKGQKAVVQVSWVEAVVGSGKSAWDQALVNEHTPPILADIGAPSAPSSASRALAPLPSAMRRTSASPLVGSLAETMEFLKREHPEEVEAGQLRVAIERSLLDCAVTLAAARGGTLASDVPEEVLGVAKGASQEAVRAAYREKAKASHPDKGGDAKSFCRLQQAYRALAGQSTATAYEASGQALLALPPSTGARDFELREHRTLVESWFEQHGEDLAQHVANQEHALSALDLRVCDVGSTNRNERGEQMRNQCFYLSLARSYLRNSSHKQSECESTALHFKRVIEAAVLAAHPDWGGNRVGEDVQAFSDFLFFVLDSNAMLSELTVVIFDSVSGGVEIYKGAQYPGSDDKKLEQQRANLLVLKYVPGHYQALVPSESSRTRGPTLSELQQRLDECSVLYVVTSG